MANAKVLVYCFGHANHEHDWVPVVDGDLIAWLVCAHCGSTMGRHVRHHNG